MAERLVGTGQQYQYISEALAVSVAGDIITITDNRTYLESIIDVRIPGITIRSTSTDPDNFPILKLFLDSNTLNHINNWFFSSVIMEPNGVSRLTFNLQNITFNRCVFRSYDYLCACDCSSTRVKRFESCLFYNFSDYVFNALQNYEPQSLIISNCTFHNCVNIFKNDFWNEMYAGSPGISNCIFTSCPNIASQVTDDAPPNGRRYRLFQQFKYCTFSNNPQTANAILGTDCFVNEAESNIYSQPLRTIPSHFKISDNTKVRNSGSDSLGYSPDLGGSVRTSPYDRGSWEYQGGPANKMILPFINYQGVL